MDLPAWRGTFDRPRNGEPRRLTAAEKTAIADSLHNFYKHIADSIFTYVAPNDPRFRHLAPRLRAKLSAEDLIPRLPRPRDLPDELDLFQGPIRVDAGNNLWIPEAVNEFVPIGLHKRARPSIYDIVDHNGKLTDRVRIPEGTTIAGLGAGLVYLASRDGDAVSLARAKIR